MACRPNPANPAPPAQTAPANLAQPAAPDTTTPPAQADGPSSFNDVMRVMLPPQDGVNPHMTSDFGPRTLHGKHDDHGGVDFNYVGGQNGINLRHPTVRSPVSGTVEMSGGGYNTVGIRDDQGNLHQILHLDSRSVQITNPPTRVQAGDPIGTMGGRVPGGGEIAQHVHYQLRDPNNRIIDPEAYWNNPQRAQGVAPAADALADDRLQRNERGQPVRQLQQNLETLGEQFHDAQGRRMAATGFYGAQTETAVRNFQSANQLEPTGVADAATRQAIENVARERTQAQPPQSLPTPGPSAAAPPPTPAAPAGNPELLTHPSNPNNVLFNRILGKVHDAEDARGIPPGGYSRNLAAALTVEVVRERIDHVDRVELSRDGSLVRAVQFSVMGDRPELNRVTDAIATQQAARQSVQESSEQTEQVAINVRAQEASEQKQRHEHSEKAVSL